MSVRVLSAPILPSSVVRVSSRDTASMSSPRRSGGIRTTSSRWTRWYMRIGGRLYRFPLFWALRRTEQGPQVTGGMRLVKSGPLPRLPLYIYPIIDHHQTIDYY